MRDGIASEFPFRRQHAGTFSMLLPPLGEHYDRLQWDNDTLSYYIAEDSSGLGRRRVQFPDDGRLLLKNYMVESFSD